MINTDTLKDALNSALDLESSGHDYYARVAKEATNPLTKEVFTGLAGQELIHAERIQEIYDNLHFEGVTPHAHTSDMERMIKGIFARFSSRERQTWEMDNAKAYEYAQQLERESIEMYTDLARKSTNPVEKQFFEELANEEYHHLTALQNVYFYLERNGDWFASDEAHVWNWMNT